MVEGKTIDEMKAQAPCSLEDTTGLGSVNPIGLEENNPPLDLRIDIAFKVIFGEKVFMIDLLNSILDRTEEITDITYQPTESVPAYVNGKMVVFDLKCTLSTGEIIIVEMQYASQSYFKERALHNKFTDKLRMIFLEFPFMKRWEDCDTKLKEWLYLINNSKDMDKIPFTNDRPIYQQLAEKARYASLTPAEQELYDYDLRNSWPMWIQCFMRRIEESLKVEQKVKQRD